MSVERDLARETRLEGGSKGLDGVWISEPTTGGVAQVEHVDDSIAEGGHDGLRHVEIQLGERPGHRGEEADVVRRVHLDHRGERRGLVVYQHLHVALVT